MNQLLFIAHVFIMRLRTQMCVSMYPYVLCQSFPFSKQEQERQKLLFNSFCSIYSTLSGIGEQKYPAHGLTIQTKQCFQMSFPLLVALLLQLATSIAVSCISSSLTVFCICSMKPPQTDNMSSTVCFSLPP